MKVYYDKDCKIGLLVICEGFSFLNFLIEIQLIFIGHFSNSLLTAMVQFKDQITQRRLSNKLSSSRMRSVIVIPDFKTVPRLLINQC